MYCFFEYGQFNRGIIFIRIRTFYDYQFGIEFVYRQDRIYPVSYTHLDVYKRQQLYRTKYLFYREGYYDMEGDLYAVIPQKTLLSVKDMAVDFTPRPSPALVP